MLVFGPLQEAPALFWRKKTISLCEMALVLLVAPGVDSVEGPSGSLEPSSNANAVGHTPLHKSCTKIFDDPSNPILTLHRARVSAAYAKERRVMPILQTKADFAVEQGLPAPIRSRFSFVRMSLPALGSASVRVTSNQSLGELEAPWQELEGRVTGATLYQSYGWCAAWIEACAAFSKPLDVRIVTVWEDGRLVLLWPLALRRLGPIGILHALAEPSTQYCDLLVEQSPRAAEWISLAWRKIHSEVGVDIVHLHNVRSGGSLDSFADPYLVQHVLSKDVAPYLRLKNGATGDADGRPRVRSGRSVNALKRHWRNLEKYGTVQFELVPTRLHVDAVVEALELKRIWLSERGAVSAGYDHPANRAAICELARRERFLITRLSVDGKTAAIEIGLVEKGHYYSLIQSYDLCFSAHAPGRLLLWKLFSGKDVGIEIFDFLPPAHPHKTEWTDAAITVTDYAVPFNWRGRLAASYLGTGKSMLKQAFARIPAPIRARVLGLAHKFY